MTTEATTASSAHPPPNKTRLLDVAGLKTWFRTPHGIVHAVDDVSFRLARGETIGIVGESGSGKSVLARAIMSLTPAHAYRDGVVRFEDRDLMFLDAEVDRPPWGSEISMIFQDPATALNPVLRVGLQITESLELHLGLATKDARARAGELLAQVGIPDPWRCLQKYPHELSGGMRQRICIAIAISCRPKLLLADEPTTALDVTIQRQILDLISSLQRQQGMAMILITHDLGVAAGRTQRIMVMYGGRVAEIGPTGSLFRETRHPYTAALLGSIPRLSAASHTRLAVIPGQPAVVVDPKPGCRFADRCRHAQARCLVEDPPLASAAEAGHAFACFYPVGTSEGERALAANIAAGKNAADRPIKVEMDH